MIPANIIPFDKEIEEDGHPIIISGKDIIDILLNAGITNNIELKR